MCVLETNKQVLTSFKNCILEDLKLQKGKIQGEPDLSRACRRVCLAWAGMEDKEEMCGILFEQQEKKMRLHISKTLHSHFFIFRVTL